MHPTTPAQPYDGSHDREIESLAEFDEVVRDHGILSLPPLSASLERGDPQ